MKREELKAMGLTEDQVNTIMKLNGQDIEAAQNGASFVTIRLHNTFYAGGTP